MNNKQKRMNREVGKRLGLGKKSSSSAEPAPGISPLRNESSTATLKGEEVVRSFACECGNVLARNLLEYLSERSELNCPGCGRQIDFAKEGNNVAKGKTATAERKTTTKTKASVLKVKKNMRVRHAKWGVGTVVAPTGYSEKYPQYCKVKFDHPGDPYKDGDIWYYMSPSKLAAESDVETEQTDQTAAPDEAETGSDAPTDPEAPAEAEGEGQEDDGTSDEGSTPEPVESEARTVEHVHAPEPASVTFDS